MRFILLPVILVLLLGISDTTTAKVGPTCFKVVAALVSRPGELFDKFQQEICDQGCQPTVSHWDLWTRNNTFLPAVRSVMKRLNVPQQEEAMVKLGDNAATTIKRRCGPMLRGTHICADPEMLAAFGNCFKKNFVRSAVTNLPTLLGMVSETLCQEQYAYLKDEQLWEETIPQNMRNYAAVCQRLGGLPQQLGEERYDNDEL
ncbi:uncharacterized protein ACLA_035290 [Aspergillus clavatus NRRL 1]|uniref:Uncharacterized protein n=1 Tax=Aspergillus clavatus (strain ATCC 1007 / CBS 513.65 / DSM 816 / NCTC 3887 / NRRL 1 / QM 1276 / 107) TaxID=344612 RepID=A1CJK2_ASPCL|nr:uncharacterized protein ACLA_035290 [Aspergillus clavatus NRRL 1]EAW09326.1 hypothetical protein ACLA_035290 [Aspergillus clavatus NRRL 1]